MLDLFFFFFFASRFIKLRTRLDGRKAKENEVIHFRQSRSLDQTEKEKQQTTALFPLEPDTTWLIKEEAFFILTNEIN